MKFWHAVVASMIVGFATAAIAGEVCEEVSVVMKWKGHAECFGLNLDTQSRYPTTIHIYEMLGEVPA